MKLDSCGHKAVLDTGEWGSSSGWMRESKSRGVKGDEEVGRLCTNELAVQPSTTNTQASKYIRGCSTPYVKRCQWADRPGHRGGAVKELDEVVPELAERPGSAREDEVSGQILVRTRTEGG